MSQPLGDGLGAEGRPARSQPLVDDGAAFYTVGQVAELLGVQPAFLRRLDTEQVVTPSRSSGGQRRYSRNDVHHIDEVTKLLHEGLTMAGAKRIIELQAVISELRRQIEDSDRQPLRRRR